MSCNWNVTTLKKIAVLLGATALLSSCNLLDNKVQGFIGEQGSESGGEKTPLAELIAIAPAESEYIVVEGGTTDLRFTLNKTSKEAQTLNWSIDSGADDFATSSGQVTVGAEADSFIVSLIAKNDGIYEGPESFNFKLSGDDATFATAVNVTLRIQDSSVAPTFSFTTAGQTISEATASGKFKIRSSVASAFPTKIVLAVSGVATLGTDYNLSSGGTSVLFAPGETEKEIQIFPVNDVTPEVVEDIIFELKRIELGQGTIDSANKFHTVLLEDDDVPAVFSIVGVAGGTDVVTNDFYLTGGLNPTVYWTNAANESGYEITIFENDGITVKCPMVSKGVDSVSHSFATCNLLEGRAYKISAIAIINGNPTVAQNNMIPFAVDTTPPTPFTILGVMGGNDISPDRFLAGSLIPTVVWEDADGESSYDVTVLNDNLTVKCATRNVPANTTSLSFDATDVLSACTLTAGTTYRMRVAAKDSTGQSRNATDNDKQFQVTNNASGYLILGITGGSGDTTADDNMDDGLSPTVSWQGALGATSYDVEIFNITPSTLRCSSMGLDASARSTSVTGCDLDLNDQYKVRVTAHTLSGNLVAANADYTFRYRVGLYVTANALGGSYLNGSTILTCDVTGKGICNSANPFKIEQEYSIDQIKIDSGVVTGAAWVSDSPTPSNGILKISARKVWVINGGTITMSKKGYLPGQGPGAGSSFGTAASGASHGGLAGIRTGVAQPKSYGDPINANTMGSGGGNSGTALGGIGGGIVDLTVSGALTFTTGSIVADGENGKFGGAPLNYGGGGAGGSVRIDAATVTGTGALITALGGADSGSGSSGGAGGRIVLYYSTLSYTGGINTLKGLMRAYGAGASTVSAAAGTVFYKDKEDNPNGYLLADNGANPYNQGVETPLPTNLPFDDITTVGNATFVIPSTDVYNHFSSTINFRVAVSGVLALAGASRDLTLGPSSYLEWRRSDPFDWDTLTVQAGGVLSHSYNDGAVDYQLYIKANTVNLAGTIQANDKGYGKTKGPGVAVGGTKGASFGGLGGNSGGGTRAIPYGDVRYPINLGSGGGNTNGGGLVRLEAANLIATAGSKIQANASLAGSGSGATGGSVLIEVTTISGSGLAVESTGGSGTSGGSGGRIAVLYKNDSYTGGVGSIAYKINGGSGSSPGASGTVFYNDVDAGTDGNLVVKNSPNGYDENVTTQMIAGNRFDSITTDASGTIYVPGSLSFTLPDKNINYRMVVEGDITIPATTDVTVKSTGYLEWRRSTPLNAGVFTIETGGQMTHSYNGTVKSYIVNVDANTILINGTIDVSRRGYTAAAGPGGQTDGYRGASYGGYGGNTNIGNFNTKGPYGIENLNSPDDLGSGVTAVMASPGPTMYGGVGGGGLIKLKASGTLTINGSLISDGGDGVLARGCCWAETSGSSGGGVNLIGGVIDGSPIKITANGGNGVDAFAGPVSTGNGSGGRIALSCQDVGCSLASFKAVVGTVVKAFGGTLNSTGSSTHTQAGAGTIFMKDSGDAFDGRLYLHNGSLSHVDFAETPLATNLKFDEIVTYNQATFLLTPSQSWTFLSNDLKIRLAVMGVFNVSSQILNLKNGANLIWRRLSPLKLDDLTIESGATLTHASNAGGLSYAMYIDVKNLYLNSGGKIDISGKGYGATYGPGGAGGGGAAYGGSTRTNSAYGSVKNPADLGSGGTSAAGGGMLRIDASISSDISGQILANGNNGAQGAGAGGTIYIKTKDLTGTGGILSANGGNSTDTTNPYSGGSGGRIAVLYETDSYAGGIVAWMTDSSKTSANGGIGTKTYESGAGTIFYQESDVAGNGHLIVRNPGHSYQEGVTTPFPDGDSYDTVTVDSNSAMEIRAGESITLPTHELNYRLVLAGDFSLPGGQNTLVIKNGGTLEFERGSQFTLPNLTIENGGAITHSSNPSEKLYWVNLKTTGNLNIQNGGKIDVQGKGYATGVGPGAGGAGVSASPYAAGGAYGGTGNKGQQTFTRGYGSIKDPADLGSGGGISLATNGGAGGGFINLTVDGTFDHSGDVVASGAAPVTSANHPGGGSGGTIHIQAAILLGSGNIIANGGDGYGKGGNGGGGRISFVSTSIDDPSAFYVMKAQGGNLLATSPGGPGSIYYKTSADTDGHLKVDNGTLPYVVGSELELLKSENFDSMAVASNAGLAIRSGVSFNMMSSVLDFPLRMEGTAVFPAGNLTIANNGKLYIAKSNLVTFNDVLIQNGGLLSHVPNTTAFTYAINMNVANMTIDNGGKIDVSNNGYVTDSGIGKGSYNVTLAGGGAGHGGAGGGGVSGVAAGGASYGSLTAPNTPGSGGGTGAVNCIGGSGGGVAQIKVTGVFDFNGRIDANGMDGAMTEFYTGAACARSGGGGSGGSIYINTGTLQGTAGTMSAKGGSAPVGVAHGGGGGGGRISVIATTNSYTGSISTDVSGGTANADRLGMSGTTNGP